MAAAYPGNGSFNEAPPPYPGMQQVAMPPEAPVNRPLNRTASNPYVNPMSQVELHISCRELLDMDVFSKSDPMCVLFMQSRHNESWREIARTEHIMNTLNPNFAKSFLLDYFFEEQQMLKFEVYDIDEDSPDLTKHDFIGRMVCSLGSILGESGGKIEHQLQDPTKRDTERNPKYTKKSPGRIIVTAEEISNCKDVVTLHLRGKKLDKKDFFGKSDPFIEIQRCNEDNSFSVVHRTEVKKVDLNPTWVPFTVPATTLCNGDYDRTLRFSCYDWNQNGSHSMIGEFDTTLKDLMDFKSANRECYELIHPNKKKKKKNSGIIYITDCKIHQKASFLDYIRGGTELAFSVAIDFTASNGNPAHETSLHYQNYTQMSQYVQALTAVGGIIEDYDTDKLFPAFGFGAKIPPHYNVSHEFPLNGNPSNPMCQGMDGIIAGYHQSLQAIQLYGPTNFAPVINSTSRIATDYARMGEGQQYFILLIVTDGIISDMEKTKEAIVNAARLPMSIIIVGVGPADFEAMEELDGDVIRVSSRGVDAERDIVQFVPFRDYVSGGHYNQANGARLAKDVLQELPEQLLQYMEKRNIKPGHLAR